MKYIIDIPEQIAEASADYMKKVGMSIEPYTDSDLNPLVDEAVETIEKEVWQTAIEIDRNTDNYDWQDMTYQEAKANYESWKKENDIHVGDEVEYVCCDETVRFVVTGISNNGIAYGFKYSCEYDESGEYCNLDQLRKTGRHFDEIEELLKKMKGEP